MALDLAWRRAASAELRRGWPTLCGATLGVAVGAAALPFYTAGVFVGSLQQDFGWSRSQLSAVSFAATLTVVICAPVAGLVVDRFGVRFPAAFSMTALTLSFVALGSMTGSFWQYATIQIALFAFGVASTPISFTRSVNGRFDAARGLALGLTLSGTGIAATIAPPAVAAIIADQGWRAAYFKLAEVVALSIPLVLLLLRPSRRVVGVAAPAPALAAVMGEGSRVRLDDPRLVRLLGAFFFLALGVSGFVLHLVPMLNDAGMSPVQAAAIQARLGLAVIAGRLVIGVAVDHFFAPRIAALSLCVTVAGIAALAIWGTVVAPWSAFAIGFALGAEVDLIGYLTVRYFGLVAYGRLYGMLYGSFILGTGFSPLLMAALASHSGSYAPALWGCASYVAIAIALLATAPPFSATRRDSSRYFRQVKPRG